MQIQEPSAKPQYGVGDASFQAAGGEAGIRQWVDDFYQAMETLPEVAVIRAMHPQNLDMARDKLARFLCGWLGGPRLYAEKYGSIHIPGAHSHLPIGTSERDQWMLCMQHALAKQNYADDFKHYLMVQLLVPAERCRTRP
jgi:hemoglobin